MKKKWLAVGISTVSVIILILASLTNVVGYQAVQTSQQSVIKERINQKELLFQIILDISNNREIQPIILKYQKIRGVFPVSKSFVLTKNQLGQMYIIGLLLSKTVSKSRMQSMVQQYQLINPEMQKEISAVINKDATLKGEITHLSNSECDCENENTTVWHPIVICTALFILALFFLWLWSIGFHMAMDIAEIPIIIAINVDCTWTHITPPSNPMK